MTPRKELTAGQYTELCLLRNRSLLCIGIALDPVRYRVAACFPGTFTPAMRDFMISPSFPGVRLFRDSGDCDVGIEPSLCVLAGRTRELTPPGAAWMVFSGGDAVAPPGVDCYRLSAAAVLPIASTATASTFTTGFVHMCDNRLSAVAEISPDYFRSIINFTSKTGHSQNVHRLFEIFGVNRSGWCLASI